MNCWNVLGIEKTSDEAQIKKAYYDKLPLFHPEDDPEGFRQLRNAFEEALVYKDSLEIDTFNEDAPWIEKVSKIYSNFQERIDKNNWVELFNDPDVISLVTGIDMRNKLLKFLMDNFNLPYYVFVLIDSTFSIKDNRDELVNEFPPNFIDFLIYKSVNEELRYEFFEFEQGRDYDEFIRNYNALSYNLYNTDIDEVHKRFEEIDKLEISHPDYSILKIKESIREEKPEQCAMQIGQLLEKYPDERTFYAASQYEYASKNYDGAIKYSQSLLELNDKDFWAKMMIGDCFAGKERFEEALEIYEELKKEYPAYYLLQSKIFHMHLCICGKLEKTITIDSVDTEKLEFINHCVNADISNCLEIAESIDESNIDKIKYYWTMGQLYAKCKDFKQSFDNFNQAVELAKVAGDDKQLCRIIADYGLALFENNEYEAAIEKYENAINIHNKYMPCRYRMANALNKLERYQQAIDCCDEILGKYRFVQALFYKAEALLALERFEEALGYANESLQAAPFVDAFYIKAKCLYALKREDELFEVFDTLEKHNIQSAKIMVIKVQALIDSQRYIEAENICNEILTLEADNFDGQIMLSRLSFYQVNYEKAIKIMKKIEPKKEDRIKLKFEMVDLYLDMQQYALAKSVLIVLVNDSDKDINKEYVYYRLADLTKRWKGKIDSIEYYKKILKINPTHTFANREISDIYYEHKMYESALPYAKRQAELLNARYDLLMLGMIHSELGKSRIERKQAYEKAFELYPEDEHVNNNLGVWYVDQGEHEKAYPYFKSAMLYGNREEYFWNNITKNLLILEKYEEGIEAATRAFELYPQRHHFFYRKAWMYQFHNKYEEAIDCYYEYSKEHSQISDKQCLAFCKIAECYISLGSYDLAFSYYDKAIKSYDVSGDVFLGLGLLHKKLQDYKNAIKCFRTFAKKSKKKGMFYYHIADVYKQQNKPFLTKYYTILSICNFTFALRKISDDEEQNCISMYLGRLFKNLGENKTAIKYFEQAAEKVKFCDGLYKGGCSESHYELAQIYTILGDKEKAELHLDKAQKICKCRYEFCYKGYSN